MTSRVITEKMRDSFTIGYEGEYHNWLCKNGCPRNEFTSGEFSSLTKKRINTLVRVVKP